MSSVIELLLKYKVPFNGTQGDWNSSPVKFELKEGMKPYHDKPFTVPQILMDSLKREVIIIVELGVLVCQPESEWGLPKFIIPKKNMKVRFVSDVRELNKQLKLKPFKITKISEFLKKLQGLQFAMALNLNMGYYTIRLDTTASSICTIVLPWGKYSY